MNALVYTRSFHKHRSTSSAQADKKRCHLILYTFALICIINCKDHCLILCLPHCAVLRMLPSYARRSIDSGETWFIVSSRRPCPRGCGRSLLSVGRRIEGPAFVLAIFLCVKALSNVLQLGRGSWTSVWTYVDVFGQELVGNAVLVDDIIVHAGSRGRRTEEETEESVVG
jgi:hypothetical protein